MDCLLNSLTSKYFVTAVEGGGLEGEGQALYQHGWPRHGWGRPETARVLFAFKMEAKFLVFIKIIRKKANLPNINSQHVSCF